MLTNKPTQIIFFNKSKLNKCRVILYVLVLRKQIERSQLLEEK